MGFTMTVMTSEEAMALPQKDRPLCYRVPETIFNDVHLAVGEASMCWQPVPSTNVFDTTQASKVAVELLMKIADELEQLGVTTEMMRK